MKLVMVLVVVAVTAVPWPVTTAASDVPPIPVRFLLTFDDGPSGLVEDNPTQQILQTLAANPVQAGIKAVFFVQTRYRTGGATPVGQSLMRRIHDEGHVLGVHSGSEQGHVSHVRLGVQRLRQSLIRAANDIFGLTGTLPFLVRPPFWAYNRSTREVYDELGLEMMMADVRTRDGKTWGYTRSLRKRGNIRTQLQALHRRLVPSSRTNGSRQVVLPVVVAMHDVNPHTASHLSEYLLVLKEEAQQTGFCFSGPPFYTASSSLQQAARQWVVWSEPWRTRKPVYMASRTDVEDD